MVAAVQQREAGRRYLVSERISASINMDHGMVESGAGRNSSE